jgi:hypothetical protein
MAYTYSLNLTPGIGTLVVFQLKAALVAGGWTVTRSSDGTTYNSTGDQISHSGTGAGGMSNVRSWFVIRQPGSNQREFCIQRSSDGTTTNYNFRIKYSGGPSTGFVGGSPSATQVPSATDEVTLLGAGTDASPTFSNWFSFADSSLIQANIMVGDAASNYNFLMFCQNPSGRTTSAYNVSRFGMLGLDTVTSFSVGDVDPVVVHFDNSTSAAQLTSRMTDNSTPQGPLAWYKKGLVGAGFVKTHLLTYNNGSAIIVPYGAGTNIVTGKDIFLPALYGRGTSLSTPNGFKGVSTLFEIISNHRPYGTMLTNTVTNDRLVLGYVTVPWNGTILEI